MDKRSVIVNARFLTQDFLTGVQRYAIEISKRLKLHYSDIRFLAPQNIYHKEVADLLQAETIGRFKGFLWEQIDLPAYLLKQSDDPILVNLANTAPLLYARKQLITVFDLSFERYPDNFSRNFRAYYKKMIPFITKRALHTITCSEFSKKEIVDCYKIPSINISVVYGGFSMNQTIKENAAEVTIGSEKYILAVASLNKRKNFEGILKAFNKISKSDIYLYVIGTNFEKYFSEGSTLSYGLKQKNIKQLSNVDDSMLIDYYKNSICLLYPSFYEGFGLPPLEAQACGTPVILSDIPVFREVFGDSAEYVNPDDIEAMVQAVNKLIENRDLRHSLIQKGLINARKYSWDISAERMIKIIERYR